MSNNLVWHYIKSGLSRCFKSQPTIETGPQTEVDSKPVNLLVRDNSPEKLQEDVRYAIQIGQAYLNLLVAQEINSQDKVVLEIGPGINYGSTLVLACHGANVMVADRFLAPWDPSYHPQFYESLKNRIKEDMPEANVSPIEEILSHKGYSPDSIGCYASDLEGLENSIDAASVDIIFSNAVLEHIYDPAKAFKSLAHLSKPGAFGFHQVDFRDHQDFSRPLEYLLMDEDTFKIEFEERHGERGNRYRPYEYANLFEQVGFQVHKFVPSCLTEEAYLNEFIPRLRAAQSSKYQNIAADDLLEIGGYYVLERTAQA